MTSLATIPFNDLRRRDLTSCGAIEEVASIIKTGWLLSGEQNRIFAADFAAYNGVNHCINVANGSDALEIAFRALLQLSSSERNEIITVANAGGYSTIAARIVGAKPVYVDIDQQSHLLDVDSAIAALSSETSIVVATHLYGGVVDVPRLRREMDSAGYPHVPILEDCAQAHGATFNGRRVGSLGELATFSFYPTKNLGALGDAGAIVTRKEELARSCRSLSQYGWSSKYSIGQPLGRNSRMDEIQAGFLKLMLRGLDDSNQRRVWILDQYQKASGTDVRIVRSSLGTVGHLAVVETRKRDEFRRFLNDRGISTDVHYPILDCDQAAWQSMPMRVSPTGLDVSRNVVSQIVSLPCYPTLTNEEVERVCEALRGWQA